MILHKIAETLLSFHHFSSFLTEKNGGHLELEKVFQFFFQMAQRNPKEVIVWKFEGTTSTDLVASRGKNKETDYINKYWMGF